LFEDGIGCWLFSLVAASEQEQTKSQSVKAPLLLNSVEYASCVPNRDDTFSDMIMVMGPEQKLCARSKDSAYWIKIQVL
jgi:hypothetical protein